MCFVRVGMIGLYVYICDSMFGWYNVHVVAAHVQHMYIVLRML